MSIHLAACNKDIGFLDFNSVVGEHKMINTLKVMTQSLIFSVTNIYFSFTFRFEV